MKIEELHWLAGYLEGEGTFHAAGSKKADGMYPTAAIQVTSVDEDIIKKVAAFFDRDYGPVKNYQYAKTIPGEKKQQFRTRIYGEAAINLMLDFYPLLGSRRQAQIKHAFLHCEKVIRALEKVHLSK